jgi:protein-L-isoaspartate(D-aspartate) O-methyltransferase
MSEIKNNWNPDDYRIARRKMVELLQARGIQDTRVMEAMLRIPRHLFVDSALAAQSYSDSPLPLGHGQTISQPFIVALMLQTLELKPGDKVLEIGSGSAYQTALAADLAGEVFAIERLEPLYQKGRDNLARLGFQDIRLKLDDGILGWPEHAPFDAIIVAAGGPKVPEPLVEQLASGGRLIVPVGPSEQSQKLLLVSKDLLGRVSQRPVADCRFVALVGRHGW